MEQPARKSAHATPVKLAVMGAGLIGRRHIEHALAVPECVLSAIIDPSPAGRELAAKHHVPWFADFKSMHAAVLVDGVIIATPNQMHVDHGLEVINAGIAALVEKPLADSVKSAIRLVEAAEAKGVPLLTGHHRRHNPMIQQAKAIMDSGRLGRTLSVHGFFWLAKPDHYFDQEWRREKGAGPVFMNLIHDIDLLRYLAGEVEAVQALESNAVRGHRIEDTCVILLKFANGALGTVNVSDAIVAPWSWEQTTGENPVYPHADQTCYTIGGTLGSLTIPRLEVWHDGQKRDWWQPLHVDRAMAPPQDPLPLQIQQFCRVIQGSEPPLVSGREGLNTLKVIEAVKTAARTGKLVKV
jgi:predicted dehydrogenase